MTHATRKTAAQEINRLAEQEKEAGLDSLTGFSRRMARYFALFPPLENPLVPSPATPDSKDAAIAEANFRSWLKENDLN